MKKAKNKQQVSAIPKGCYECGLINYDKKTEKKEHLNEITTDAQGNGYPISDKDVE